MIRKLIYIEDNTQLLMTVLKAVFILKLSVKISNCNKKILHYMNSK